jgi:hypothetical protein
MTVYSIDFANRLAADEKNPDLKKSAESETRSPLVKTAEQKKVVKSVLFDSDSDDDDLFTVRPPTKQDKAKTGIAETQRTGEISLGLGKTDLTSEDSSKAGQAGQAGQSGSGLGTSEPSKTGQTGLGQSKMDPTSLGSGKSRQTDLDQIATGMASMTMTKTGQTSSYPSSTAGEVPPLGGPPLKPVPPPTWDTDSEDDEQDIFLDLQLRQSKIEAVEKVNKKSIFDDSDDEDDLFLNLKVTSIKSPQEEITKEAKTGLEGREDRRPGRPTGGISMFGGLDPSSFIRRRSRCDIYICLSAWRKINSIDNFEVTILYVLYVCNMTLT